MSTLNGQLRPVQVRDRPSPRTSRPRRRPTRTTPGHVAAPFAGVVTLQVEEGDTVAAGATVATIEAMKMEAVDHRPARRHGRPPGHRHGPAGRGRRPARRDRLRRPGRHPPNGAARRRGGLCGGRRRAPRGAATGSPAVAHACQVLTCTGRNDYGSAPTLLSMPSSWRSPPGAAVRTARSTTRENPWTRLLAGLATLVGLVVLGVLCPAVAQAQSSVAQAQSSAIKATGLHVADGRLVRRQRQPNSSCAGSTTRTPGTRSRPARSPTSRRSARTPSGWCWPPATAGPRTAPPTSPTSSRCARPTG